MTQREILVVEDEPSILGLLEKVLARAGYLVRACGTPAEALLEEPGFVMVVADYSLPGMDGLTLIARLRERHPGLPAILCSGVPMAAPATIPPILFVQKPYRAGQLSGLIAQVLERNATM